MIKYVYIYMHSSGTAPRFVPVDSFYRFSWWWTCWDWWFSRWFVDSSNGCFHFSTSTFIRLPCFIVYNYWLVVSTPLKNLKSILMIIPHIWENRKCSKPPIRLHLICFHSYLRLPVCIWSSWSWLSRVAMSPLLAEIVSKLTRPRFRIVLKKMKSSRLKTEKPQEWF